MNINEKLSRVQHGEAKRWTDGKTGDIKDTVRSPNKLN